MFDTRLRPWYIQAATCSKDVVILLDTSGSMNGMHQAISQLVIKSLLKTFNNDDSINIIFFNTTFTYLVPCFKEILIQVSNIIILYFIKYYLCIIHTTVKF